MITWISAQFHRQSFCAENHIQITSVLCTGIKNSYQMEVSYSDQVSSHCLLVPAFPPHRYPIARLAALVSLLFEQSRPCPKHSLSDQSLLLTHICEPPSMLLWLCFHFYKLQCYLLSELLWSLPYPSDTFLGHLVEPFSYLPNLFILANLTHCPYLARYAPMAHHVSVSRQKHNCHSHSLSPEHLHHQYESHCSGFFFFFETIQFLFFSISLSFPWCICQNEMEPVKISEERVYILSLI